MEQEYRSFGLNAEHALTAPIVAQTKRQAARDRKALLTRSLIVRAITYRGEERMPYRIEGRAGK